MEKNMALSVFAGETEQKVQPAQYIGNLNKIGLGQENGGITSNLTEQDFGTYAEAISFAVAEIDDKSHIACIDGRCTVCQINGESEAVRSRIAGGILSYNIGALLSDVSLSKSLSETDSIMQQMHEIEKFALNTIGIKCSSHEGGCGAANGLIDHLKVVNSASIEASTEAVLELASDNFKTSYDANAYEVVSENATKLAKDLESQHWQGNDFVNHASSEEPGGVEKLESDASHNFNGHKEQSIILVTGNKTISKRKLLELGLGQAFVVNLDLINDMAVSLSGLEGQKGYSKALHALVAYQLAVASNLCNKNMPMFIV
jgi:hypothetical protein